MIETLLQIKSNANNSMRYYTCTNNIFLDIGRFEGTSIHCILGFDASEAIINQLSKPRESTGNQERVSEQSEKSAAS